MLSDEEYFAIKRRAAAVFRKIPGVHSVGLGGRERQGQPTGEPVIKVFVLKKVPVSELAPDQVIPAQFEGVATDVVESGRDVLLSDPPPGGLLGTTFVDDARYRPLRGGAQIQGANRRNRRGTRSSVGARRCRSPTSSHDSVTMTGFIWSATNRRARYGDRSRT
jgi:hypothetical protein